MPALIEKTKQRFAGYYLGVLYELNQRYRRGGGEALPALDEYIAGQAQIEHGREYAASYITREWATKLCRDYPDAGGDLLRVRQNPHTLIRWLEDAICAARQLQQEETAGTYLGSLGLAYADLGKYEKAVQCIRGALAISHEFGDRRGEGGHLGHLGTIYVQLRQYTEAISCLLQAKQISEEFDDALGCISRLP